MPWYGTVNDPIKQFLNCIILDYATQYKFDLTDCRQAFDFGYHSTSGEPVDVVINGCQTEDIENTGNLCPTGWYGNKQIGFCFKIIKDGVSNTEGARYIKKDKIILYDQR
jgi:hypothetical protein